MILYQYVLLMPGDSPSNRLIIIMLNQQSYAQVVLKALEKKVSQEVDKLESLTTESSSIFHGLGLPSSQMHRHDEIQSN